MNVCVDSSIIIFRDGDPDPDDGPEPCADYLRSRELAERAAAKTSPHSAARKVHRQLADSYAARRKGDWNPTAAAFSCNKEG